MKIANFILSIYLILLSCLPCADTDVKSLAHTSIELSQNAENHSHDTANDLCPPFCVCNCCGVQFLSYQPAILFDFPVATTLIKIVLPTYKSIFSSNFFGSIWQPPQIV
jgi:hypothetical protein